MLGSARASNALSKDLPRHRVGILFPDETTAAPRIEEFKRGMKDVGYAEGAIEYVSRWYGSAEGVPGDRFTAMVRQLVEERVGIIVTTGVSYAAAIQAISPTTPVVLTGGFDPVDAGVADSLSRPGRSVTGIVSLNLELLGRHLQLTREVVPTARRVGVLHIVGIASHVLGLERIGSVAQRLGMNIIGVGARSAEEAARTIAAQAGSRLDALLMLASPTLTPLRKQIAEAARGLRILTVYSTEAYVDAGGIMSYGPNIEAMNYRGASFVDRILKGTKAGDIPIEQASKYDLVINLKVAKAIGLAIPQSVLVLANRVID